jgi:hypothetical protein
VPLHELREEPTLLDAVDRRGLLELEARIRETALLPQRIRLLAAITAQSYAWRRPARLIFEKTHFHN